MSKKRSKVHPKYKTKYRVGNWSEYDRPPRRRDCLVPRRGGHRLGASAVGSSWASAIETALGLRLVYGLPWRQTEGLLRSLMRLLGLDLSVPDHTTLSRRARAPRVALPARG